MNEEQLLKDIANDPANFSQVYEAFHDRIFGYVYRRTTNYEAARDITAETFLKACVNVHKFKWQNISLLYWLYKIATNELNRYFNNQKYSPYSLCKIQEEYGLDIIDRSHSETDGMKLKEELERHQEFMRVNESVRKLDLKYQDVISLRFFEHKSIKEIAMILDKKEGTIKSLLSRGIEKLKDKLISYE